MDVLREIKKMRLSPVLVAVFAATTTLNLAETDSAWALNPEPPSNPESSSSEDLGESSFSGEVEITKSKLLSQAVETEPDPEETELNSEGDSPSPEPINPIIELVEPQPEVNLAAVEFAPVVSPPEVGEVEAVEEKNQVERETADSEPIATPEIAVLENSNPQVTDYYKEIVDGNRENLNESSPQVSLTDVNDQNLEKETSLTKIAKTPVEPMGSSVDLGIMEPSPPQPEIIAQQQAPETPQPPAQEPLVLVAEVLVQGATGELEDIIYEVINTQPGSTTTRSQLQEDLNAIFATGFFANVQAVPEDTPLGVRITFQVEPNPVLREVVIENVAPDSETILPQTEIERIFGEQYGQILNLEDFKRGTQQINDWYQENGYDLAQIVGSPQVSPEGVVSLVVAEGVIEDVQVRYINEDREEVDGNTREFIVTREVELKPGDVFNRNTARQDLQRVFGLGIFDDVQLSFSPGEDPSKVVVNVDVQEGSTGSLAAGAGFSSSSGLFGTVSYQQRNFGGNNQTLGAEVQLGTRSLLFDARFTDPWIGGDPFRTSYTVNAFRRRSISLIFDGGEEDVDLPNGDTPRIVRTGGGVTFFRPLSRDVFERSEWNASAGLQYQRVAIEDSDGDVVPRDENGNLLSFSDNGEDDLFLLQFGLTKDDRDNRLRPTSGSFLRFGLDQSLPIGSGSILMTRLRASYSFYLPVEFTNFSEGSETLAFNFQAGNTFGDLPPYEAFSIGGTNSVRGFDEGDVGSGRRYFQATAEYRFPVISIFSGALFADFGTDLGSGDSVPGDPAGERDKPGTGFGYGLGVRIQSPLGPIRIDYGLSTEGDSRIHFGIGERF